MFCDKTELLWQSPVIDHTDWKTYDLAITPQLGDKFYLIFEADYSTLPSYFGNILIDNIQQTYHYLKDLGMIRDSGLKGKYPKF